MYPRPPPPQAGYGAAPGPGMGGYGAPAAGPGPYGAPAAGPGGYGGPASGPGGYGGPAPGPGGYGTPASAPVGGYGGPAPGPAMGGPGMGGYGGPAPAPGGYGAPAPAMGGYGGGGIAQQQPHMAGPAGPQGIPQPPPAGGWSCPACYAPNAQFMERCGQCRNPKPMDLPLFGAVNSQPGVPVKQGDWYCSSCGNHNFAWRGECNKCGKAKDGAATLAGGGPTIKRPAHMKPGDWICPDQACQNLNFQSRTACNKCGKPKPEDAQVVGPQLGPVAGMPSHAQPGDWVCPDCSNLNFSWRTDCNKCGKPKSEDAQIVGPPQHIDAVPGVQLDSHVRPGDWVCGACHCTNFSWRDKCHKCEADRPADAQVVTGQAAGGGSRPCNINPRPGDWICPSCGNTNFQFRTECNQCGKAKPAFAQTVTADQAQSVAQQYGGYDQSQAYGSYDQQGYGGYDQSGNYQQYGGYDQSGNYQQYGGQQYGQTTAVVQGRIQPNVVAKPGDWVCSSCANTNFQWREACHKCGQPKSEDAPLVGQDGSVPTVVAPVGGGGGGVVGSRGGQGGAWREGDWICSSCGNNNFSWREACNKCAGPKSAGTAAAAGGGGGGGRQHQMREGDWECTCGNHNFSFRTTCNKCGAAKSGAGRARSRSRSPLRGGFRPI